MQPALDFVDSQLDWTEPYFGYQPTDENKTTYRFEAYRLVNEAYEKNMVSAPTRIMHEHLHENHNRKYYAVSRHKTSL